MLKDKPKYSMKFCKKRKPDDGYLMPFKYFEADKSRRIIFSKEQGKLIPFDQAMPHKADSIGEGIHLAALPQESALMLSQLRFMNDFPIASSVRMLLANMTFYPGFDISRYSNLRTKASEIKPITNLYQSGENLGTVLHEIFTRYDFRQAATDIKEFLKVAYNDVEDIYCETTFGAPPQVLVRVREKKLQRSLELWELSDGMLRFLCIAAALLNPAPPPFMAIDEPEIGLHLKLLPVLADMIIAAAERTQVLITHIVRIFLIDFKFEDIAVMSLKDEGCSSSWHCPANRKPW